VLHKVRDLGASVWPGPDRGCRKELTEGHEGREGHETEGSLLIQKTLNAIGQLSDVEVDQKRLFHARQSEIREHLGVMNRRESFDALQFHEQFVFHK
jgi:hypothetical protein